MTTYTIKIWNTEYGQPTVYTRLTWRDAWFMATELGYSKAQVISEEFGTVELETKS